MFFFPPPPTAESFGVSAQIGSGVVRGGPEVRFHEGSTEFHQGSTRVPPGLHQGSTSVPRGFHEVLRGLQGGASTKKSTACCWGCHLRLFYPTYGLQPVAKGVQSPESNSPSLIASFARSRSRWRTSSGSPTSSPRCRICCRSFGNPSASNSNRCA